MTKIISNKAKCLACGDIIESRHRHDFVECSCGAIFVDGGHDYFRAGGDPSLFESLSVVEDEDADLIKEQL